MRDAIRAFCRFVEENFVCPEPVYEFGAYQVEGQEGFADLREFFPGRRYVGCDLRLGPGVDRVENVSDIRLPDAAAGTVLCVETFEHVFDVRRGFEEIHRILRPGGVLAVTTVLNFPIHEHPADYWRMTPQCLKRLMKPYAARLVGYQGDPGFPHTVLAVGIKAPASADATQRAERFMQQYGSWLREAGRSLSWSQRLARGWWRVFGSPDTRRRIHREYVAEFEFADSVPSGRTG